jgi:hypothetical protein
VRGIPTRSKWFCSASLAKEESAARRAIREPTCFRDAGCRGRTEGDLTSARALVMTAPRLKEVDAHATTRDMVGSPRKLPRGRHGVDTETHLQHVIYWH